MKIWSRARTTYFLVFALSLIGGACSSNPANELETAKRNEPVKSDTQDPETTKRIAQIKGDTLILVKQLVSSDPMPTPQVLKAAKDKGFPAMISDLEFLDKNLPSSDPDRPDVERYLKALKKSQSQFPTR